MLELLTQVAEGKLSPLSRERRGTPRWLASVIERALSFEADARWADGHAFAAALVAGQHAPSKRGGPLLGTRVLGSVALVAAAGVGGAFLIRARAAEQRRQEARDLVERAELTLWRHGTPSVPELDRAIELAPLDPRAWIDRALTRSLSGDQVAAGSDIDRALALAPDSARALSVKASIEWRGDKHELARVHADQALAHDSRCALALRVVGGIELEQPDDPTKALGTARLAWALARDPGDPVTWRLLGHGLAVTEHSEAAIEALTRAVALDPKHARSWVDRAILLSNRGEHAKALADAEKALALEPGDASALAARAYARAELGQLDDALADADRALALDAKQGTAFVTRGIVAHHRKKHSVALTELTNALELSPDNSLALFLRSKERFATGDAAGALADANALVRAAPSELHAWVGRGELRQLQGDVAGAIEDFGKAIELNPKEGRSWLFRGKARDELKPGDGQTDFEHAVELDATLLEGWVLLERGYLRAGAPEAALRAIDKAYAQFPDDSGLWTERAAVLSEVGRVEESEAEFARALSRESTNGDFFILRGTTRADRGDLERAILDYDRALELKSKAPYIALLARAEAYAQRGEPDKALADATAATSRAPRSVSAWACVAFCRLQSHDVAGALNAATRAVSLEPDNPFGLAARGLCRAEQGELDGARADLELAFAHTTSGFARGLVGKAAERKLSELRGR